MPRNVSDVFNFPPGTEAVAGELAAAEDVNARFDDIKSDLNAPRPVSVGGTGAFNPSQARANLNAAQNTDLMQGLVNAGGIAVGKFLYTTAANVFGKADITALGRNLVAAATASAARAVLELGAAATRGVGGTADMDENPTDVPTRNSVKLYYNATIGDASQIGSVAFLGRDDQAGWNYGQNYTGLNRASVTVDGVSLGGSQDGTWRCLGAGGQTFGEKDHTKATLFVRVG